MKPQNDTSYGINRLQSKTARAAIIQKISSDFNLIPIIAEAYYKQIASYFAQHAEVALISGQICYEAVATEEPAGKRIALAKKVSYQLTLFNCLVFGGNYVLITIIVVFPYWFNFARNSATVPVPFIELQAPHNSHRFSKWSVPPLLLGIL